MPRSPRDTSPPAARAVHCAAGGDSMSIGERAAALSTIHAFRYVIACALVAGCLLVYGSVSDAARHEREASNNLFLVHLRSGKVTRLTRNHEEEAGATDPSWSPDGSRIVFSDSACESCPPRIRILDVAARRPSAGRALAVGRFPRWSPVGGRIAFVGVRGELEVLDIATRRVRRVSRRPAEAPTWSPDGRRLAYVVRSARGLFVLYSLSLRTGRIVRLTWSERVTANPAWSPDGGIIAFTRQQPNGRFQLCTVRAAGGGVRKVSSGAISKTSPTWAPDASKLAFIGTAPSQPGAVYTMSLAGGPLRRWTPSSLIALEPAWSPRGDVIAFVGRANG